MEARMTPHAPAVWPHSIFTGQPLATILALKRWSLAVRKNKIIISVFRYTVIIILVALKALNHLFWPNFKYVNLHYQ